MKHEFINNTGDIMSKLILAKSQETQEHYIEQLIKLQTKDKNDII